MKLSRAEWLLNSTFFSVVEAILQAVVSVTTSDIELVNVKELGWPVTEIELVRVKELWYKQSSARSKSSILNTAPKRKEDNKVVGAIFVEGEMGFEDGYDVVCGDRYGATRSEVQSQCPSNSGRRKIGTK